MPPVKKPDSGLRDLAVAFTMATNFVITFVVIAGIGYGIDWWRNRGGGGGAGGGAGGGGGWGAHAFTLIGVGLGLVMAVVRIVIDTQRMEAAERRRKASEKAGAARPTRSGPTSTGQRPSGPTSPPKEPE